MRVVGVVLMIIGALLGGTGGYALAQYVRSGDWVLGPTAIANPGGEHVVVSKYGVLAYDSDIRVTAASQSLLILATANPIDVDDYTDNIAHATITSLSSREIGVTSTTAVAQDPPVAVTDVDFWLTKATGPNPELVIASASDVTSQAVLVSATGEPIRIRVDYRVAGIRTIVFGVIGTGAALALIGLVLFLVGIGRARRRKHPKATLPTPVPVSPYGPALPPPWAQGPLARWVAGLVAVSLIAASAGCSMPTVPKVPKPEAAPSRTGVTKVPLASDHTSATAGSIAHRAFIEGIDGYAPKYSTDVWSGLYTELALQPYVYDSTYAKAAGSTSAPPSCEATIETAYRSAAKAYPMAATALVRWNCIGKVPYKRFTVLTREHSYSPWMIAAESRMEPVLAPEPGTGDPTAAEMQAGSTAAAAVLTYLNKGTVGPVTPPADLKDFYTASNLPDEGALRTMSSAIQSDTGKQGGLRFGRTATGTLVSASYVSTVTTTARPEYYIWWPAPLDTVLGQPGHRTVLTEKFAVFLTMLIEGDKVTVVGFELDPIL